MATETGLKHTLFNLFGASKHPTQGHVWEKINKFRNPTEFSQLKNHPLYGIKGWALALLIWLVVSAAFGVFMTHAFGYSLKLMNPRAFAQIEDHHTFELVAVWIVLGWSCVTAYLLWTKDEKFHMSFFYQLVTVIVLQIINSLSYDDTDVRATGVIRAFMLLIVFVPLLWYSFRSKRIAVTCAGMLRHDDPFLHRLRGRDVGDSANVTTSDADRQTPSEPISTVTQDDEDEEFYKQVWDEWERDEIDNGLRAKAFVESGGNDEKTKAIYLKLRVQQLGHQRRESLAEKRKIEEERQAKAEKLRQEQAEQLRRDKEEQLRRENEIKRQEKEELARKEAKHQAALVKVRTENKRKKWRLIRRTLYGATLGGYLLIAMTDGSLLPFFWNATERCKKQVSNSGVGNTRPLKWIGVDSKLAFYNKAKVCITASKLGKQFHTHSIAGPWMLPTLSGSYADYVISSKTANLHRGDIVVFQNPNLGSINWAARLVGFPGDKIGYFDKRLRINGITVPFTPVHRFGESTILYEEKLDAITHAVLVDSSGRSKDASQRIVPPNRYLLMSDNRVTTNPKNNFSGFVPHEYIIGVVQGVITYRAINSITSMPETLSTRRINELKQVLKQLFENDNQ